MISFRRKWLCMIVALFFVFICTHTANAESGEITIPVPQESTEYADLESEEFILVMEESSGSYHIPAGVEGSTEVYAKLELQKRAEIWVDCYIGGGNSVSYDLLLADKETVVTSYTRTCNHMNDKKLLLGVLPAGTYYLRLHNLQVNNNDCAGYITSNFKTNHYEECDGVVDDDMSS
ncbi:MAG: hypothetical protein IJC41_06355, partial [Firmicutes bacterium]|nr:hypothetical protein [Bacillota bacterium]